MSIDGLHLLRHIPDDEYVQWLPLTPDMRVIGLLSREDLSHIVDGIENDEDMWDFCQLTGTWHCYVMTDRRSADAMAFCVIEARDSMTVFHGGRVPDYPCTQLVTRGTAIMLKTLLDLGYDVRTTPAHDRSMRYMSAFGFRRNTTERIATEMRLTHETFSDSPVGKRMTALLSTDHAIDQMGLSGLLRLKNTLSKVNNRITTLATIGFVDYLLARDFIPAQQAEEMKTAIRSQHANANGYDIKHLEGVPIIAEIKCNIPVKRDEFGAAQANGIKGDITGLLQGKKKEESPDAFKFMVILNTDRAFAGTDTGRAIERLLSGVREGGGSVAAIPDENSMMEKNIVYIVNLIL